MAGRVRERLRLSLRGSLVRHRGPESYLEAVAWELDGESQIADSATVENPVISDNVHVLDGAEVVDSTIEGSVVFQNTTISDS